MAALFSEVLNMSLTASLVIVFVLAARLLLKKAPKVYSYALWAVVLFRLLCPVSLSAPVSLLTITDATVTAAAPRQEQTEQGRATTVNYLPAQRQQSAERPQTAPLSAASTRSYFSSASLSRPAIFTRSTSASPTLKPERPF